MEGFGGMPDQVDEVVEAQDAPAAEVETVEAAPVAAEDVSALKSALEKERLARKERDRELKETAKRLADLENAGKSDVEKLAAERDAWQQRYEAVATKAREATGREQIVAQATKAGAPNPELVYRLVRAELAYDDDGELTNAAEAIASARQQFPELFKTIPAKADTAAGMGSGPEADGDWLRRALTARR